jgi:hypothetical protein
MLKKFIVALVPISLLAMLTIPISSAQNQPMPMPPIQNQPQPPVQNQPMPPYPPMAQPTPQGQAAVVCAGDTAPKGMVITATGNSPICAGSCTARRLDPINGSIMVICANQPIPKSYTLESITTSPSCKCLSDEDNAYIIRNIPTPTPTPWRLAVRRSESGRPAAHRYNAWYYAKST